MTRLFVDQHEIPFPASCVSLDQLLRHIEATELRQHTVICQVHVDGSPVVSGSVRAEGISLPGDITDRDSIEVFTGSLEDVARESIEQAVAYLDRVAAGIPALAADFQGNPGPDAFDNLRQLYEGFYFLNLLLDRLEHAFNVVPAEIRIQGSSIMEQHERLASVLRQLIESQMKSDFILISDLLEYEILPYIPIWKEIFGIFGADAAVPA